MAGTYDANLVTAQGCDSIATLVLSIDPIIEGFDTVMICQGIDYTFIDTTIADAGDYTKLVQTNAGCDSLIYLHLIVEPILTDTVYASTCLGVPYPFNGTDYSVAGTYDANLVTAQGCDSIATLVLSIDPIIEGFDSVTICQGIDYTFIDTTIADAGDYTKLVQTNAGCDSLIYLHLIVEPILTDTVYASTCLGVPYPFNGTDFSVAGTYDANLVTAQGCDSIATLVLSIDPIIEGFDTVMICQGIDYTFIDTTIADAGDYTKLVQTNAGCDSLIYLHLIVEPILTDTVYASTCLGVPYPFNGTDYSVAGTYDANLVTAQGCDSIATLVLSIDPIIEGFDTVMICQGIDYTFIDTTIAHAGDYTKLVQTNAGCDSLIYLHLIVEPILTDTVYASTCLGVPYPFNGTDYSVAGTYDANLVTAQGCDSIATLVLSIDPIIEGFDTVMICQGIDYTFIDTTIAHAGDYTKLVQTNAGCDSLIYLHLIVEPILTDTVYASTCLGVPYPFNGTDFSVAGTYDANLVTAQGCDSIATLVLSIDPIIEGFDTVTICQGIDYTFIDTTIADAGDYTKLVQTNAGCDSLIYLHLIVEPILTDTVYASTCLGVPYPFNGTDYSVAGTYDANLVTAQGCDSIATLVLSIDPIIEGFDTVTICQGIDYTFIDTTIADAGDYTKLVQTNAGCDSLIYLHLIVEPILTDTVYASTCLGVPYPFNGTDYSVAGTYDANLVTAQGCDSIATLVLSIDPIIEGFDTVTICQGIDYTFIDTTIADAGDYTKLVQTNAGCDSLIYLHLIVEPILTDTVYASTCLGVPYPFNGTDYSVAGTYDANLVTAQGCDSIATLVLSIDPIIEGFDTVTICQGIDYDFLGTLLFAPGDYSDTIQTAEGCDSLINLHLIIDDLLTETIVASTCQGVPYIFNGVGYNNAGTYDTLLTTADGCDSLVTLVLSIDPILTGTINVEICYGASFEFNNMTLTEAGTHFDTVQTTDGCDSIITLNLTVAPVLTETINVEICQGASYEFNNMPLTEEGTHFDTVQTADGCDSIITLNLTVAPVLAGTIDVEICQGASYVFNNMTLTEAGTHLDTVQTTDGCDSIITLNLTVAPVLTGTMNVEICQGASYVFNNMTLTEAGTHFDTVQTANGCDSIITLNLTVAPVLTGTMDVEICEGASYLFNNMTLTETGTHFDTVQTADGCDSIITLNLTVAPVLTGTINVEICQGASYEFNNMTLTEAGTHLDTVQTAEGCDSIITLNLTVAPVLTGTMDVEICQGDSYVFNNMPLTEAGTHLDTVQTTDGCDSIITLNLTVAPVLTETINVEICQGASYEFNNMTLTEAGTHLDTVQTAEGCDSIITLNLTVAPVLTGTMDVEICQGASYVFNNMILTEEGTHFDTVQTAEGCDSIITLNLTVAPVLTETINVEICQGASYEFNNMILTEAGTHFDTVQTAEGCDSIITLNLTVAPVLTGTMDVEICQGASYVFNNMTLTEAGTHLDTVQTTDGCDSIITLNLTVAPVLTETINVEICQGASYEFNNMTLTEAGTHLDTVQTAKGCDSIITLNLTVAPVLTGTMDVEICQGASYEFNNMTLTEAGTHFDTVQTTDGCDSIITLNLTVAPVLTETINVEICQGASYEFNNMTLTEAGTHLDTVQTAEGCDSIITLNLTVAPVLTGTMDVEICQGASYVFNNITLTEAGTHLDTVQTADGCDSIITLNLTVAPVLTGTMDVEICQGASYVFNNITLTEAGTHLDTVQTADGCDSIITLNLTVAPVLTETINVEICQGASYVFNNITLTEAGTHLDTVQTADGCDSIITLNLTVAPVLTGTMDVEICQGASYEFNNMTLSEEGTHFDTVQTTDGCDSIITLNLTVAPVLTGTMNVEICQGASYVFNNITLTEAGTHLDTVQTADGCDSIITLNLTVAPVLTGTMDVEICQGASYEFNNMTLSEEGTHFDTVQTTDGCDSIITLNLTVAPVLTGTMNVEICQGASYVFNNMTLTEEGTHFDTVQTADGCDSIITLNLTVAPALTGTINVEICQGASYEFNNMTLTEAGTHLDTVQTADGCDSIITLNLTVAPVLTGTINVEICQGASYEFNNLTLTEAGTHLDTVQTAEGCDSIITLNLTVAPVLTGTINVEICQGASYVFNNMTLTEAGTHLDTVQTADGCDSIITLNLTVAPVLISTMDVEICQGASYVFNNMTLTEEGTYFDTVQTTDGCDSIITLNLTVAPVLIGTMDVEICQGASYVFNNMTLTEAGTHLDTVQTADGCDSIITLNLTVAPVLTGTMNVEICQGASYVFNNMILTEAGTHLDTVQNRRWL